MYTCIRERAARRWHQIMNRRWLRLHAPLFFAIFMLRKSRKKKRCIIGYTTQRGNNKNHQRHHAHTGDRAHRTALFCKMNRKMEEQKIKSAHDFFPFCLMFGRLSASLRYFLAERRRRRRFVTNTFWPFVSACVCMDMNMNTCVHHSRKDISTHSRSCGEYAMLFELALALQRPCRWIWWWAPNVCFSLVSHCSCPVSCGAIDRMRLHASRTAVNGNGDSNAEFSMNGKYSSSVAIRQCVRARC